MATDTAEALDQEEDFEDWNAYFGSREVAFLELALQKGREQCDTSQSHARYRALQKLVSHEGLAGIQKSAETEKLRRGTYLEPHGSELIYPEIGADDLSSRRSRHRIMELVSLTAQAAPTLSETEEKIICGLTESLIGTKSPASISLHLELAKIISARFKRAMKKIHALWMEFDAEHGGNKAKILEEIEKAAPELERECRIMAELLRSFAGKPQEDAVDLQRVESTRKIFGILLRVTGRLNKKFINESMRLELLKTVAEIREETLNTVAGIGIGFIAEEKAERVFEKTLGKVREKLSLGLMQGLACLHDFQSGGLRRRFVAIGSWITQAAGYLKQRALVESYAGIDSAAADDARKSAMEYLTGYRGSNLKPEQRAEFLTSIAASLAGVFTGQADGLRKELQLPPEMMVLSLNNRRVAAAKKSIDFGPYPI